MASLQDKYVALLTENAKKRNTYVVVSYEVRKGNIIKHDVKQDQDGHPLLSVLKKDALQYAMSLGVKLYESEAKQDALRAKIIAEQSRAADAKNEQDDTVLSEVEPKKPGRKKAEDIEKTEGV